jgi:peroxiredoxin
METRMTAVHPPVEGNLIPAFELPRAGGGGVRVRSYRGRRSLALYFLHGVECEPCRDMVAAIVPRYGDYALNSAEPLIIVPDSLEAAEAFRAELSVPFPVLVDADCSVRRRYRLDTQAALLVCDRFGTPVLWQCAGPDHTLPDQDAVLREVEYLAYTCSGGCSTPIWWGQ